MLAGNAIVLHDIEDEERREHIRQHNFQRCMMRHASDSLNQLRDEQFCDLYRITKDMARYLTAELSPHMSFGNTFHSLTPEIRILAALFFFANGSYQRVVGHSWALSMSQQSVSRCVNEVSNLIVEHMASEWIVFPTTQQEITREKIKFMRAANFPGTIGAVDCTHVRIMAPAMDEHAYFCRKQFHSKNVQIVSVDSFAQFSTLF